MPAGETRYPRVWWGLPLVLAAVLCGRWSGPWRVAVKGLSMAPLLVPGDLLLVCPVRRLCGGDLVVFRDPVEPHRWVVKRVAALPGEQVVVAGRTLSAGSAELVVLGDNPAYSTDSRQYGAVPLRFVHGRVWYRYAPPARSGRLPAR